MKNFLRSVFGLLFPPSSDQQYIATHESPLKATPFSWHAQTLMITSLLHYHDALVQALIRAAKFDNDRHAQHLLGNVLAAYLQQHHPTAYYIPMPLSAWRYRQRGHNHVMSILEAGRINTATNILGREHRDPQTSLPREKRLTNVAGSFQLTTTANLEGSLVVLIDDVGTTGATLRAAYDALKIGKPASIILVTIAH